MLKVGVIDFGLGNLFSVNQALIKVGADVCLVANPEALSDVDAVLLPGVGAFGEAMSSLKNLGLDIALKDWAKSGKPLLGICLGMQLLMEESEEFGTHKGLGIFSGQVCKFPNVFDHKPLRIPHMGWESLTFTQPEHSAWKGLHADLDVYFVHSYFVKPIDNSIVIGKTSYEGFEYATALAQGNVWGMQFHPEKSGEPGLKMYQNWLQIVAKAKKN